MYGRLRSVPSRHRRTAVAAVAAEAHATSDGGQEQFGAWQRRKERLTASLEVELNFRPLASQDKLTRFLEGWVSATMLVYPQGALASK